MRLNEKGLFWFIMIAVAVVLAGGTAVGPASGYIGLGADYGRPFIINLFDPAINQSDNEGWYNVAELKYGQVVDCDSHPREDRYHGLDFRSPVKIIALNDERLFKVYCQDSQGNPNYINGVSTTVTIEGPLINYCKALPEAKTLMYGSSSGQITEIPNCLRITWAETNDEDFWSGEDDFKLAAGTKIQIHKSKLDTIRGTQKLAAEPQVLVPGLSTGTVEFTIAPYDAAGHVLIGSEAVLSIPQVELVSTEGGLGKASVKLPAGTYKAFYEIKDKNFATEVKGFTVSPGQTTKVELVATSSITTAFEISFEPTDAADAVNISGASGIIQVSPKGAETLFVGSDKISQKNGKIILNLITNQAYEAIIKVKGFEEKKIELKPVKDEAQNKLMVMLTQVKVAPANTFTPAMRQSREPAINASNIFRKGLSDLK